VTPGPVWQVTSNTPSGVPRPFAELVAGAREVVGAAEVTGVPAPVDGEGAAGVPTLWQPLSRTTPARPTVGRTRGVRPRLPGPTRESMGPARGDGPADRRFQTWLADPIWTGDGGPSDLCSSRR
jgi:hypothetical protein